MGTRKRGLCWAAMVVIAGLLILRAQSAVAADTTGPQVSLAAPTGSVSGTASWSATASDPSGVQRVEFWVDGAILEIDRSAPFGGLWDTTRWFAGPHTVFVRAYDTLGNKNGTSTTTVTVNNQLATVFSDPQRFGIVGSDLMSAIDLSQQIKEANRYWTSYHGVDSPEGGFMASLNSGATQLPATLSLPQTLQAGQHYLFVKGYSYGSAISVGFAIGGGTATVATDDNDGNAFWSVAVPITTQVASNQLTLTVLKGGVATNAAKFLLRGLYVTNDPEETVLKYDTVIKLHADTSTDTSSPQPGNLIENSSFETGLGHGWGMGENRLVSLKSLWDTTPGSAYQGGASVKMPLSSNARAYGDSLSLLSKAYALKPNKLYTLSAWVKADPGDTASGILKLVNTFSDDSVVPAGFPPPHQLTTAFTAGSSWTQVSVTDYVRAYPTADYQVQIVGNDDPGRNLWVDAVSLTEGNPVTYVPKLPLEIGLVSAQPSNLYYNDEQVLFQLRSANGSSATQSGTVRYEVYDYLNRMVKSGSVNVSAGPGTTDVNDLDLGTGQQGSFRVVLWLDGVEGSEEEVLFGVVPRPQVAGPDPGSSIGIQSDFAGFEYDALQKLGVKWDRAMSPASLFRWIDIEPQENQFVWHDDEVNLANSRGIQILGTLGGTDSVRWPAWADDGGLPNLDKWQAFVGQTVAHYRGRVAAWEIWNEPIYTFQPDFYAQMVKRAAEAIKQNDPAAKVVAMGGSYSADYDISVMSQIQQQFPGWPWQSYLDVFSMHMYPPVEMAASCCAVPPSKDFSDRVETAYGKPIWNTESAWRDQGFFHSTNAPSVIWGRSLFPYQSGRLYTEAAPSGPESVAVSLIQTLGYGLGKYFYYDFRAAPNPSLFRNHTSALEYDDSIRPKGIAMAAFAKLLDHSTGLGRLNTDTYTEAMLFDRGGTPLVALFTDDNANRSLTLSGLTTSQLRLYDVMGNPLPLPDTTIEFGRMPVYLEGQGISDATLRAAVEQGTIRDERDLVPPNLTINVGPRGPVLPGGTVRFRWGAADDTYSPGPADPNAIVYSYRLTGPSSQSSWSSWSATSYVDLSGLERGDYVFEVMARDGAGNQSAPVQRSFQVQPYPGFSRPKGATPLRAALAIAYRSCGSSNHQHGAPLAAGSCQPPVQSSAYLTVGTSDANGKLPNAIGRVRYDVKLGNSSTTQNEADVKIDVNITDVRKRSDLSDYSNELSVNPSLRITDKWNGVSGTDDATTSDLNFPITTPCAATGGTADIGGTCSIKTSFNAVTPNVVLENKRAIWQLGQVQVYDGGSDGVASTTADNTLFMDEGIFVP